MTEAPEPLTPYDRLRNLIEEHPMTLPYRDGAEWAINWLEEMETRGVAVAPNIVDVVRVLRSRPGWDDLDVVKWLGGGRGELGDLSPLHYLARGGPIAKVYEAAVSEGRG